MSQNDPSFEDIPLVKGCGYGKEYFDLDLAQKEEGRYSLFHIADNEQRSIIRFAKEGTLAHLGIVGATQQELAKHFGLGVEDIVLMQTHHGTPIRILEKGHLRADTYGGGFMGVDPERNAITLKGKSKNTNPDNIDPVAVHAYASMALNDYLKAEGSDYKTEIEGLDISEETLQEFYDLMRTVKPSDLCQVLNIVGDCLRNNDMDRIKNEIIQIEKESDNVFGILSRKKRK